MDKLIPVEGYSGEVIGFWNENKNIFELEDGKPIEELLEKYRSVFHDKPMFLRVSDFLTKEGRYISYCSFDQNERIITVLEPNSLDFEKWWE